MLCHLQWINLTVLVAMISGYVIGIMGCGVQNPPILSPEYSESNWRRQVSNVECGDYQCCAISDGHVRCWGHADTIGPGASIGVIQIVGLPPIKQIAMGSRHRCALSEDGEVYCWGMNMDLAADPTKLESVIDVTQATIFPPSKLEVGGVANEICCASSSCVALLSNGHVASWGSTFLNQAGRPPNIMNHFVTPGLISRLDGGGLLEDVITVACNSERSCAVTRSGDVWCWGSLANECENTTISGGTIHGQFGASIVDIDEHAIDVSVSNTHACAILADRSVVCWGSRVWLGGDSRTCDHSLVYSVSSVRNVAQLWIDDHVMCYSVEPGSGLTCFGDIGRSLMGRSGVCQSAGNVCVLRSVVDRSLSGMSSMCFIIGKEDGLRCVGEAPL